MADCLFKWTHRECGGQAAFIEESMNNPIPSRSSLHLCPLLLQPPKLCQNLQNSPTSLGGFAQYAGSFGIQTKNKYKFMSSYSIYMSKTDSTY